MIENQQMGWERLICLILKKTGPVDIDRKALEDNLPYQIYIEEDGKSDTYRIGVVNEPVKPSE